MTERDKARNEIQHYLEKHVGETISLNHMYDLLVAAPHKKGIPHWMFYAIINEMIQKGSISKEPVNTIIDYNIIIQKGVGE